jgi:serine/threonine kinase 32
MPPEMIQQKPYSFSVDYWQLGVVLYELIYEKLPFGNNSKNPIEIF